MVISFQPRVLMIVHAPVVGAGWPGGAGLRLHRYFQWNNPDELAQRYIDDVREVTHGLVDYQVAERVEIDGFPVKVDGFRYTTDDYIHHWRQRSGFHQPDAVDYYALLADHDVIPKVNAGAIDEVWLFAFPYAGYYESLMAGPGAFWCNAPPLEGTSHARRRFVIMGFNYERGVGEMLEDLGHRAESILSHVYRHQPGDANLWERFTRYDKTHRGRAECGNVHFAPNSERDYDWGNRHRVTSLCDNWLRFPDLSGPGRVVDCSEWGNGDIRLHHRWWFQHFPHVAGATNDISHNWWEYVIDPNRVA